MNDTAKPDTNKQKKRKYVPGLAQLDFEPPFDWEKEEASRLYEKASFSVEKDKIHYGDCIKGMRSMAAASVDLIIADPPFGIDFSGKGSQYNRDASLVKDGYHEIDDDYGSFTKEWLGCLPRIMKTTSSAYIFSGWTNLGDILNGLDEAGLSVVNHIIWKYQFGVFTKNKFVSSHYHVLFVVKDENNYFFNKYEYYPEDVWIIPRKYMPGQEKNGTKLPEDLVMRCINFSSKPGDLIFDPFIGNGTTATCAKGLYRHYAGFEMNKELQGLHQSNLEKVALGEFYRPLREFLPSIEELIEKYPHLKKYIDE